MCSGCPALSQSRSQSVLFSSLVRSSKNLFYSHK
jgi:hypothetical protein